MKHEHGLCPAHGRIRSPSRGWRGGGGQWGECQAMVDGQSGGGEQRSPTETATSPLTCRLPPLATLPATTLVPLPPPPAPILRRFAAPRRSAAADDAMAVSGRWAGWGAREGGTRGASPPTPTVRLTFRGAGQVIDGGSRARVMALPLGARLDGISGTLSPRDSLRVVHITRVDTPRGGRRHTRTRPRSCSP